MKCGWICLVEYPFTDGTGAKVRPVLVVSLDTYNTGEDVVVVPISSRPDPNDPHSVYIESTSPLFSATGLKQSSSAKWTKPFTMCKTLLVRRLGHLGSPLMSDVATSILTLFSDDSRKRLGR